MRIGFTGHRPSKIFYKSAKPYSKYNFNLLYDFIEFTLFYYHDDLLSEFIFKDNINTYNTGGALGFDTVIAERILLDNTENLNLYLPFKSFGSNWYSNDDRIRLEKHKHYAQEVIYTSTKEGYSDSALYTIRNKAIVNNSDIIIALWNGSNTGTKNCIDYAEKQNKKVINIWDNWREYYETTI